jgi:hypothetical protein
MSKARKTLTDILSGRTDANISFADLCHLLERAAFTRKLGKGSHTLFFKEDMEELTASKSFLRGSISVSRFNEATRS